MCEIAVAIADRKTYTKTDAHEGLFPLERNLKSETIFTLVFDDRFSIGERYCVLRCNSEINIQIISKMIKNPFHMIKYEFRGLGGD